MPDPHGHLHRARGHDRRHHRAVPGPPRSTGRCVVAFGAMVLYLLLFRLTLPYSLVRRNPERSLLLLLPFFHAYARLLSPLVRALRRRAPRRAATAADEDDADAGARRCRPPPCTTRTRAAWWTPWRASRITQVRDVMTPRPDIVALPASATVGDLRRAHARDEVQPDPRLRREPGRHRGRGRPCATSSTTRAAGRPAAPAGAARPPGARRRRRSRSC